MIGIISNKIDLAMLNYAVPVIVSIANRSATFATRTRATRSYRLRRSGGKQAKKGDYRVIVKEKPKRSPQNTTPPECSSIPYLPPPKIKRVNLRPKIYCFPEK